MSLTASWANEERGCTGHHQGKCAGSCGDFDHGVLKCVCGGVCVEVWVWKCVCGSVCVDGDLLKVGFRRKKKDLCFGRFVSIFAHRCTTAVVLLMVDIRLIPLFSNVF